jgi:hypothetical protein
MGRRRKGFAWNEPQPKDEGPRDLKALKVRPKGEFTEAEFLELQCKAEAYLGHREAKLRAAQADEPPEEANRNRKEKG